MPNSTLLQQSFTLRLLKLSVTPNIMHVLILFGFLAGIATILSPCILPVLPVVLSGATVGGRRYPFGIVIGFVLSFSFFTLFLTTLVNLTGISANTLRYLSIIIILLFGLVLLIPKLKLKYELLVSKWTSKSSTGSKAEAGFPGGLVVGASLGLIWTPCAGPILASVIALALTGSINGTAVFVTLAYAVGTSIPMFLIMIGGRSLLNRVPWLLNNLSSIQKLFGVLMILVAIALTFNIDRKFQTFILDVFPNYGTKLTQIEDNDIVRKQLDAQMPNDINSNPESTVPAPELIPGGEWFNSKPLTLEELRGKVVLVDFWTYSCINCIRTLPYLRDWHEKYSDDGLVIIGVHTPEFEFEKSPDNLRRAIRDFDIKYPVVQDNDYETWRAYSNRFWPAKYFIDAEGNIDSFHFGEGDYEESEQTIQRLLKAAGHEVDVEISQDEVSTNQSQTPETYLGSKRTKGLASPQPTGRTYTFPNQLKLNEYALSGDWQITKEYAQPQADARLRFQYNAKDVFLVMNVKGTTPGQVEISLDDQVQEIITVDSNRLYDIIKLNEGGEHLLELKFLDDQVEVYAFTFG